MPLNHNVPTTRLELTAARAYTLGCYFAPATATATSNLFANHRLVAHRIFLFACALTGRALNKCIGEIVNSKVKHPTVAHQALRRLLNVQP